MEFPFRQQQICIVEQLQIIEEYIPEIAYCFWKQPSVFLIKGKYLRRGESGKAIKQNMCSQTLACQNSKKAWKLKYMGVI